MTFDYKLMGSTFNLIKVDYDCAGHSPLSPSLQHDLSGCTEYHMPGATRSQMGMVFEGHHLLRTCSVMLYL